MFTKEALQYQYLNDDELKNYCLNHLNIPQL